MIDFVSLGLGPLHTGIFNVADVAIMAGIVMVLISRREPRLVPAPIDDGEDPRDETEG